MQKTMKKRSLRKQFTKVISGLLALIVLMVTISGCRTSKIVESTETPQDSVPLPIEDITGPEETAGEDAPQESTEPTPIIADVLITTENWDQYFEIVDTIEDQSIILGDASLYSFKLLYSIKLRDHIAAVLDQTQDNTVTFDMTYKECFGIIRAAYESTSIYDEGEYSTVKSASAQVVLDPVVQNDALITEQMIMFSEPIDNALGTVANNFQVTAVTGHIHIPMDTISAREVYPLDNGMTLTVEIIDSTHLFYSLDVGKEEQYITSTNNSREHGPDYQWTFDMYADGYEFISGIILSVHPNKDVQNRYVSLQDFNAYCQNTDRTYLTSAKVEKSISGSVMTVRVEVPQDSGIDFTAAESYSFYKAGSLEKHIYYEIPKNGTPFQRQIPQDNSPSANHIESESPMFTSAIDFCTNVNNLMKEHNYNLQKDSGSGNKKPSAQSYTVYSNAGVMENVGFAMNPSETIPGVVDSVIIAGVCASQENIAAFITAASAVLFNLNSEYTDFEEYIKSEITPLFEKLNNQVSYSWKQGDIQYDMLALRSPTDVTFTLIIKGLSFSS